MLPNRSVPDVQEKRENYRVYLDQLCEYNFYNDLVFVDESGVNINMERRYGRAPGGERVVDYAPVNTPVTTTVISAITSDGPLAQATWQGGTTKARLIEWVKNTLIPSLRPGQIIIWDNLAAHHSKEVVSLLQQARIAVLYTPPYSPDLNPIEMMWSKMKEALRKLRIRIADDLPAAVKEILEHNITRENCVGWFRKDGYVQPAA